MHSHFGTEARETMHWVAGLCCMLTNAAGMTFVVNLCKGTCLSGKIIINYSGIFDDVYLPA